MVSSHHNVVVLAEIGGPPPAWYTQGFSVAMETPYANKSVDAFNCAPLRGGEHKTLFTLSNWIDKTAPSRSDAAVVNAFDFIIDRVDKCSTARGHIPTYIAVQLRQHR